MSRQKLPLLMLIIGIVLILAAVLWYVFSQQFGSAALRVESSPEANVYINDELVGRTPYSGEFKAGDISLSLIPLAFDSPRMPFEQEVKLTSGVETVVRRSLGETQLDSSGEIISFERNGSGETAVAVVTKPDNARVLLQGHTSEHSPIRFSDIKPQIYTLTVTADGYGERSFSIEPKEGYTLTVIVDLAKSAENLPSSSEENTITQTQETQQKYVVILSTPTGFLRVRSAPSTTSNEVTQVESGKEFELLETDQKSGWYKIKLDIEAGEGWISNEYSEIKQQSEQQ